MMDFTLFIKSTTSHILCCFPPHVSNHCCCSTHTKNNLHSIRNSVVGVCLSFLQLLGMSVTLKMTFFQTALLRLSLSHFFISNPCIYILLWYLQTFSSDWIQITVLLHNTSSYKPPLKYCYNHSNQTGNQTWKKSSSFTCSFYEGELVFHHWNVHASLNLPSHKNLYKMGKVE